MSYFEMKKGQDAMESIASSLNKIAMALEENNRLLARMLQSEQNIKHLAKCDSKPTANIPQEIV